MGVNDEVRRLSTWFPANGQECVLTGWDSLDKISGGLRNGEVVVASGYSNMGKTTFVINLIKVTEIRNKVDTINNHIDKVLEDAPTKLTVTVKAKEEDLQAIQDEFDKKVKSVKAYMLNEFRSVNDMMIEERRRSREKFQEYDGVWFVTTDSGFSWPPTTLASSLWLVS